MVTFKCNKIIFKSKSEDYFHFFFWVAELLVKKFSHFQHTFTIRVKRLTARAWIIGTPIKQCTRLRALPRDLRWWVMHNRSFQNIQTKNVSVIFAAIQRPAGYLEMDSKIVIAGVMCSGETVAWLHKQLKQLNRGRSLHT